jgi:hypothetical protein
MPAIARHVSSVVKGPGPLSGRPEVGRTARGRYFQMLPSNAKNKSVAMMATAAPEKIKRSIARTFERNPQHIESHEIT